MKVLTRFVTSAADQRHFPPPGAPEIAFLGRSNVGKSTLINSLVGSKTAKTSNTPGRTQTINFYQVRRPGRPHPDYVFADLPGYGYARVPKEVSERWAEFINPYLEKREPLALCLCLVDASVPPQQLDIQLLEWLRSRNRRFLVVATKADRISKNELRSSLQKLASNLQIDVDQIVPYSAREHTGDAELWRAMRMAADPESPEEGDIEERKIS